MFIQVRLLNGFSKPLLYAVSQDHDLENPIGRLVRVPVRNKILPAVIIETMDQAPHGSSFTIKHIHAIEPFPYDPHYYEFVTTLGRYYQTDPFKLIQLIRHFMRQRALPNYITTQPHNTAHNSVVLTDEQEIVTRFITAALQKEQFTPTVLHGVTGSGKTEVYKKLIQETIALGKSVILLLPEVTLALRIASILREQLPPDIVLCNFHSASSAREKLVLWQRLINAAPTLILGVHMPILLPITRLGLIIVDEEHEVGYQEKRHPKINSKEAALLRAQMHRIPILLGSATPSLSSLHNVKKRGWYFFQLKKRFAGSFPIVNTVFLTNQIKRRRHFWISTQLEEALATCLAKQEQAIIFLNRRGHSFFVQCSACTFIFSCTNCSVSLTLHDNNLLSCHYCGFSMQQPTSCFSCSASEESFLKKGIGTQQAVSIIQKLFPTARIGRADLDVTIKKKEWQETVQAFQHGKLDILVGTQTIAKGFHFPGVTLVGIIWADLNLHFPLFNASETTLQQLIQVAGRAGRQRENSRVIVQAMTDHPIFAYLNEIDYLQFYAHELQARSATHYPPIYRLAEIELKNHRETDVERDADSIAEQLLALKEQLSLAITILGPAQPPVHTIQKVHIRKIYLKSDSIEPIIKLFEALELAQCSSSIFFTPNPVT